MNIYGIIILAALLIGYTLELLSDLLNIQALKSKLPDELYGIYDESSYAKSQQYTRAQTRFGLITDSVDLLVILLVWFSGWFNELDLYLRHFGFNTILTGLLFTGILLLGKLIYSLPFQIYSTFVIEEKFGFNKTKPITFILDLIKVIILSILFGGLVLSSLLAIFEYAGPGAWFYCWVVTTMFILFIQIIAPTWIMPLFNKFTPLEEGELKTAIMEYAESVNFSLENIFVIDGSRRSGKSNAFFTGFGKHKRIALFDTLVSKHSVEELVAILAHEIGHYKRRHLLKGMVITIIHLGFMLYFLSIFVSHKGLFDAFYMTSPSVYAGFIFFGLLFSPIEMIVSVVLNYFSRNNEYEADRFAAGTIDNPDNLILALKKLSVNNLSNLTPHPLNVFLHYSHPTLLSRIDAIHTSAGR